MEPRSSVHTCILFIIAVMFCISSTRAAPVAPAPLAPYPYRQSRISFSLNDAHTTATAPSPQIYRSLTSEPRHIPLSSYTNDIRATSPSYTSDPSSSNTGAQSSPISSPQYATRLLSRSVQFETSSNGTVTSVFDSSTLESIAQSSASDGSGTGLWGSVPTIIWLVFCFLFGVPMALAGVRGWRFTVGSAVGLSLGMACMFLIS